MVHEQRQARAELAALCTSRGPIDAARLERALGELALAAKTLQRGMVEKGLCTHDELSRTLRELNLADGRAPRP